MIPTAPNFIPQPVQGYENVGVTTCTEIKNPHVETRVDADPTTVRNDFHNVPLLSEDEAKEELVKFVNSKCCYGKDPVKNMTFTDIQSSNTHRYVLETFTESRTTQWIAKPYAGQPLNNNGMPPPMPWDIPAQFREIFKNETLQIEVPNTSYIKACDNCNGSGSKICTCCTGTGRTQCCSCRGSGYLTTGVHNPGYDTFGDHHGSGHVDVHGHGHVDVHGHGHVDVHGHGHHQSHTHRQPCSTCNGVGSICCSACNSNGRMQCCTCNGCCRLVWYIQLNVIFQNNVDDFIKKSESIPDDSIRNCVAHPIFSEQSDRVYALNHHPNPIINKASYDLIQMHLNKFRNSRIRAQRHSLLAVPVTLCKYTFKQKEYKYFVFGIEKQVYLEDYPQKCLCCSIL